MSEFHASQFIPNTRCSPFDCACGSCGMSVAFAGGPQLTHDQVRTESGVSCVPGIDTISGGLRIADVERVAKAHGVFVDYGRKADGTYTSWTRDALRQRLVAGHGAILLGDCQDAPVNPTVGVVLHSAFVHGLDANGRTHWHDPRLSQAYWITLADVITYWESFNGSVRYAGFVAPDQAGNPPDTSTGDGMAIVTQNPRSGLWNLSVVVDGCSAIVLHNGATIGLEKGTGKQGVCKVYVPSQGFIGIGGDAYILGDEDPSSPDSLAVLMERDVTAVSVGASPPPDTATFNAGVVAASTKALEARR